MKYPVIRPHSYNPYLRIRERRDLVYAIIDKQITLLEARRCSPIWRTRQRNNNTACYLLDTVENATFQVALNQTASWQNEIPHVYDVMSRVSERQERLTVIFHLAQ